MSVMLTTVIKVTNVSPALQDSCPADFQKKRLRLEGLDRISLIGVSLDRELRILSLDCPIIRYVPRPLTRMI